MAKENKTTLPSAALFIIRYHSFYREFMNWRICIKFNLIILGVCLSHYLNSKCHVSCLFQHCTGMEPINTSWMMRIKKIWSGYIYLSKIFQHPSLKAKKKNSITTIMLHLSFRTTAMSEKIQIWGLTGFSFHVQQIWSLQQK